MSDFPELYVMRHGQTEWNLEARNQGSLDSPLTALGQDQAHELGHLIASLGLLSMPAFTSPQMRAVHTAQLAGLSATPDARLAEVNMGDAEGMLQARMHQAWPELAPDGLHPFGWYFRLPNSECFSAVVTRVTAFLQELDAPAVVVSHGITSRVLRGIYQGLDVTQMRALPIDQGRIFHLKNGRETIV